MKCRACDALLSDFEASRKSVETTDITEGKKHYKREYIDLCNYCFESSDKSGMIIERLDLMEAADEITAMTAFIKETLQAEVKKRGIENEQ